MASVIGQRWEVYPFGVVKSRVPKKGEIVCISNTPEFGGGIIQLTGDGGRAIHELYEGWKSGEASPFLLQAQKGVPGGIAELDSVGRVPAAQLPNSATGGDTKSVTLVIGTAHAGHALNTVDILCTGTNDHTQINNAIAALPAGGGKIVIREGTYNLGGPINVDKDNVTIEGMGPSTILNAAASMTDLAAAPVTFTANNCKLANLKITNNYDNNIFVTSGVSIIGRNNTVSGCEIASGNYNVSYGYGVYISGYGNTVSGCIISNIASGNPTAAGTCYGVFIGGSSNTLVFCNTFSNQAHTCYGVYLNSGSNTLVFCNTFSNISGYGVNCGVYLSSSGNNLVSGNTFSNSTGSGGYGSYGRSYGVYVYSSNNNLVSGNTFSNISEANECYGVYINGSGNAASGNVICNSSGSYGSYGIYIGGSNNDASRNTVANQRSSGQTNQNTAAFYLPNTATHCRIHGNDISGVTAYGGAAWFNGATYYTAVPAGSPTGAAAWQSGSCGFNIVSRPA